MLDGEIPFHASVVLRMKQSAAHETKTFGRSKLALGNGATDPRSTPTRFAGANHAPTNTSSAPATYHTALDRVVDGPGDPLSRVV
jgi:hypothetical protein